MLPHAMQSTLPVLSVMLFLRHGPGDRYARDARPTCKQHGQLPAVISCPRNRKRWEREKGERGQETGRGQSWAGAQMRGSAMCTCPDSGLRTAQRSCPSPPRGRARQPIGRQLTMPGREQQTKNGGKKMRRKFRVMLVQKGHIEYRYNADTARIAYCGNYPFIKKTKSYMIRGQNGEGTRYWPAGRVLQRGRSPIHGVKQKGRQKEGVRG